MKKKLIALCLYVMMLASYMPVLASDSENINEIYVEYNAKDATENIQHAIYIAQTTPGRDRIIISNQGEGKKWISGSFSLCNNMELYLEPGVVLEAREGHEFEFFRQSFVLIEDKSNVSVIGGDRKTSKIRMRIDDYTDSEHRHCISIAGGKNIEIKNITLERSGGDGICISDMDLTRNKVTGANENILVDGVICYQNARNGLSVISGNNIVINDCQFLATGRANPPGLAKSGPWAGIDVEPEKRKTINNLVISNCNFERNGTRGILFALQKHMNEDYLVADVINCTFKDSPYGINLQNKEATSKEKITFTNCTVSKTNERPIIIKNWGYEDGVTVFKNCIVEDSVAASGFGALDIWGSATRETGNILFDDLYVFGTTTDSLLSFSEGTEEFKIKDINGTIHIEGDNDKIVYNEKVVNNITVEVKKSTKTKEEVLAETEGTTDELTRKIVEDIQNTISEAHKAANDYEVPTVKVDGAVVEFTEQDPVIVNDRTLVPMRAIFEKMGAEVEWIDTTRTVNAKRGTTTISLTIDSTTAYKKGQPVKLDVAPTIMNGRTMVPLRFISEALGADVEWVGYIQGIYITDRGDIVEQKINGNEIIVDCSTEGYQESGALWATASGNPNHDGSKARTSTYTYIKGEFTPVVTYTPIIAQEGDYDVYVWKFAQSNSDSAASLKIVYDKNKTYDCEIQNFTQGENEWIKLTDAPLHFKAQTLDGSQKIIQTRTEESKGYTRGSAIKLVKVN